MISFSLKRKKAILAAAAIIIAIGGVFAAQLFTQTFPSITRPTPPPPVQAHCGTLVTNSSAAPPIGTGGYIFFNCGSSPAFTMVRGATVSPTFTLPSGYVSLWLTVNDCNNPTLGLQNGGFISLISGDYNYCALVDANTPTLGTFDVTWNGPFDNTSVALSCPSVMTEGGSSSCGVTVTDTTSSANTPTGTMNFASSDISGNVTSTCTLASGHCTIAVGPVSVGTFTITGTYPGDSTHAPSSGTSTISVHCLGFPICV